MWKDTLLITLSCVLFIQMGLSGAIQDVLHFHFKPLSCVKCLSFWSNLVYLILSRHGSVSEVIGVSFLCSYLALWLALAYDALALTYNKLYEYITKADGTSEDATTNNNGSPSNADEVPEV